MGVGVLRVQRDGGLVGLTGLGRAPRVLTEHQIHLGVVATEHHGAIDQGLRDVPTGRIRVFRHVEQQPLDVEALVEQSVDPGVGRRSEPGTVVRPRQGSRHLLRPPEVLVHRRQQAMGRVERRVSRDGAPQVRLGAVPPRRGERDPRQPEMRIRITGR